MPAVNTLAGSLAIDCLSAPSGTEGILQTERSHISRLLLPAQVYQDVVQAKELSTRNTEIIALTGTHGSGKSTLRDHLFRALNRLGVDFRVIINDIGKENIDANSALLELEADKILALSSGCICCTDAPATKGAITALKDSQKIVIIDSLGSASPQELRMILEQSGVPFRLVTMLDIKNLADNLALDFLKPGELGAADLIICTHWSDIPSEEQGSLTRRALELVNQQTVPPPVVFLTENGELGEFDFGSLDSLADRGGLADRIGAFANDVGGESTNATPARRGHGIASKSLYLSEQVEPSMLANMIERLRVRVEAAGGLLVRVKGRVGGLEVHGVHGDLRFGRRVVSPEGVEKNYLQLRASVSITRVMLEEAFGIENIPASNTPPQLEKSQQEVEAAAIRAVEKALAQLPASPLIVRGDRISLAVDFEGDVATDLIDRGVNLPQELKARYLAKLIALRVEAYRVISEGDLLGHLNGEHDPKLPYLAKRVGSYLAWLKMEVPHLVEDAASKVAFSLRPAQLFFSAHTAMTSPQHLSELKEGTANWWTKIITLLPGEAVSHSDAIILVERAISRAEQVDTSGSWGGRMLVDLRKQCSAALDKAYSANSQPE